MTQQKLTILKQDPDFFPELDFSELRKVGLEHITRLSGKVWTDHNLHDPGITILEVLIYALIDLAYRTKLPVEDVLAPAPGQEGPDTNFFTPAEILSCNPLTILDYRKLLIDIPGVRNAWLEVAGEQEVALFVDCKGSTTGLTTKKTDKPLYLNGLYNVLIELENTGSQIYTDACGNRQIPEGRILDEVKKRLHAHRNLAEDFLNIRVLRDEEIGICADFELHPNADPEDVLVNILSNVQAFLSPVLPFYSLRQMLDKGKTMEEIFAGRPLITTDSHGFVDMDELEKLKLRREIHISDVYREILKVAGVVAVKNLKLVSFIDGQCRTRGEKWCLKLTPGHRPVLSFARSQFTFSKGVLRFNAERSEVQDRFEKRLLEVGKTKLADYQLDAAVPYGKFRPDLGDYYSIQHEFPLTYRIGKNEMLPEAPVIRKAQALQLKGYLLFFDQLLANYLAQLANLRQLFSLSGTTGPQISYFTQSLDNVPDIEKLVRFYQRPGRAGSHEEQEVLATATDAYPGAFPRDLAIRNMIRLFEEGRRSVEVEYRTDLEAFVYWIEDAQTGEIILNSAKTFQTEEEARAAAEILDFLGTIPETYGRIDNFSDQTFSFQLVYNTVSYVEYLGRIQETTREAESRRDAFLNHLLARFSEDFTDYALLMFALQEGRSRSQDEILRDKANMLSCYPEISRNRGKAFDYTDKAGVWNTDNLAGLSRRMAKLMGIDDFQRKTLANFSLTRREDLFYISLQMSDMTRNTAGAQGEILLESTGFDSDPTKGDTPEKDAWLALVENPKNYRCFDCPADSVYGFEVLDAQGKTVARHPHTYGTAELRDAHKECVWRWVKGRGLLTKIQREDTPLYLFVYDEDDHTVLVSTQSWETEAGAWEAWQSWQALLAVPENLQLKDLGDNIFTVHLLDPEGNEVAIHPGPGLNQDDATELLQSYRDKFSGIYQGVEFSQRPALLNWSLDTPEGNEGVSSAYRFGKDVASYVFENEKIAADAFAVFLHHAADPDQYDFEEAGEQWYFEVLNEDRSLIARSRDFPDLKAAHKAARQLIRQVREIRKAHLRGHSGHSPEQWCRRLPDLHFHKGPGRHYFTLFGPDKKGWLQGVREYPEYWLAVKAWHQLRQVICEQGLHPVNSEDGCRYSFTARLGEEVLAVHPEWYLEADRIDRKMARIKERICQALCGLEIDGRWYYQILRLNCDGLCETMFNGRDRFFTQTAALEAAAVLRGLIKTDADGNGIGRYTLRPITTEAGKPGLCLAGQNDADPCYADYYKPFATEEERAAVINELYGYLRDKLDFICQVRSEKNLIRPLDVSKLGPAEAFYSGFRLQKDDSKWAVHPKVYGKAEDRDMVMQRIQEKVKCRLTPYRDITIHCSTAKATDGKWYYEIIDGETVLWRGAGRYETRTLAKEACDAGLADILDLARNASNYHWQENCLVLRPAGKEIAATVNGTWQDEAERQAAIKARLHAALDYPLVPAPGGYELQLYCREHQRVDWKGMHGYATLQEALIAFECFLEVVRYEPNYTRVDDHDFCRFGFELGEVLLESRRAFKEVAAMQEELTQKNIRRAEHPIFYGSPEVRNTRLNAQFELAVAGAFPYRQIPLYWNILAAENACWALQITFYDEGIWMLPGLYTSKEDAKNDAAGQLFDIHTLAADPGNYFPDTDNRQLVLRNKDQKEVALFKPVFQNPDDPSEVASVLEEAIRHRIRIASLYPYPYVTTQKGFGLELAVITERIDGTTGDSVFAKDIHWKGTGSLVNLEDAEAGFLAFLQAARRRRNYLLKDLPDQDRFGFELAETYTGQETPASTPPVPNAFNAWEWCFGLKSFLRYAQDDVNCYRFVDYARGCCYGFRIVDDEYRLAVHPKRYSSLQEREAARDRLYSCIRCQDPLFSTINVETCRNGIQYFFLLIGTNVPRNSTDIVKRRLWKSYEPFTTAESARSVKEEKQVQILENSREAAYYQLFIDKDGLFSAAVTDDDGAILVVLPQGFETIEELRRAVTARILFARKYPFTFFEGTYGFQIYCEEGPVETFYLPCPVRVPPGVEYRGGEQWVKFEIPGEVIWENVHDYNDLKGAQEAFDLLVKIPENPQEDKEDPCVTVKKSRQLLYDKVNYQRVDRSDCGPFGLEITDPQHVLADHPRVYRRKQDLEKALEKVKSCISSEGFHLVEHILLRPRDKEKLFVTCPDCDHMLNISKPPDASECGDEATTESCVCYIPEADPYSFRITVVIPFWPRRFRDLNFREFFETRLREETPAHIALRILWVDPRQMRLFETAYRNWLSALSAGEQNCLYEEAHGNMMIELNRLRNVYPPAALQGDGQEANDNLVVLNKSQLS